MNTNFTQVEETLFVPMLGRIYCTENFPHILNDAKAVEIGKSIPTELKQHAKGNQYTQIASAVRSANMDRYIQDFMKRHPDGVIIQIGCGLETTFYRNDDGKHHWIELDLPEVIKLRKDLLGETERDSCFVADVNTEVWIQKIRERYPTQPLFITSSGVFYYFTDEMVRNILKNVKTYGNAEVVFDTVSKAGMQQMHKHMKNVGHKDTPIYFYVNKGKDLAEETGAKLLAEEAFYAHTSTYGMSWKTKLFIWISDWLKMVKMIHLKF